MFKKFAFMVTVTCSDSHIENSIRQTSPPFYSDVHALICQSLTFSPTAQPHNRLFGSRAFRISAPKIYNSLLPHILFMYF